MKRLIAVGSLLALTCLASPAAPAFPMANALPVGSIVEFPLPNPTGIQSTIVPGPDGRLWFPSVFPDWIGAITTKGAITPYRVLASGSAVYNVATGADGNLWLAEHDGRRIGKMSPSGSLLIEYPLPGTQPYGMTAGSDGNLWWTDEQFSPGKIGQTTMGGTTVEFNNSSGFPKQITAGPDGNLWFTADSSWVGKVTPTGTVTDYPIPTTGGNPIGITAGPDGALWFAEQSGNKIGRVTTAGSFTEYPVPTPNASPQYIAAGADGNLWFTEQGANKVGRITPAGVITEYLVPTSSAGPIGITVGPDGNLWFMEGIHKVARLWDAAPNTSYVLSMDAGFVTKTVKLKKQGNAVKWVFLGPSTHTVTDASGMGLFDSGAHGLVSYFSFSFIAAGSYPYKDTLHSIKGTVKVPIVVQPGGGSNEADVTWASQAPPSGYVYDVQVEQPGSSTFVDWKTGQTATGATFGPSDALYVGAGLYNFQSRMRKISSGKASGYSTPGSISLT